ncbi:hypothetical protein GCM10022220_48290 [Actinocatenispora rupis]|uniref:RNA polymerase sigma-70 region 2 domain-containing protein n=1 Tax=Actinocatenispora rupis TaxID=519421 RepID=A0A8J3JCN5_9ACTN|nr:hypothetical protein Aru02nite_32820 [Actinocatenispora rupis]
MACLHALHASFPRDIETGTETRPRRGTAVDRRALDLLDLLARLPADDPRRADTRTRVIEAFLPFATRLARRYAGSAESLDDLVQVAAIGLIEAVDRYDPDHPGHGFLAFATPTIRGELRRHFRDRGWAIRPPRGVQELRLRMQAAESN